eukprot:8906-Heterococcus_DN1.PRE.5
MQLATTEGAYLAAPTSDDAKMNAHSRSTRCRTQLLHIPLRAAALSAAAVRVMHFVAASLCPAGTSSPSASRMDEYTCRTHNFNALEHSSAIEQSAEP